MKSVGKHNYIHTLSLSLSLYLSPLSLSIYLSPLSLTLSIYLLSLYLSPLSLTLSIYLLSLSISLSIYLSISSLSHSLYLSPLSLSLSIYLSVCLSVPVPQIRLSELYTIYIYIYWYKLFLKHLPYRREITTNFLLLKPVTQNGIGASVVQY